MCLCISLEPICLKPELFNKKKVKGRANWILRHMVNYWCIFFLKSQVKHEVILLPYEKIPGCIRRHNSSSFSYQKLCTWASLLQNKEEESKTNLWKSFGCSKSPCPTTASLFLCSGSSDWVHSSCTLSIERSDLLACQGKHCSRKQSKSTYLAPLKLLLFSLANLCNSHGEAGKEFDEAYNDD